MLPKIKIYTCGVCEDYFTKNSSHYKRHVRRCRNKRDPSLNLCDLCDFEASSMCELKEHKSKVHWPSGLLQCEHCEYRTQYRKDLNRHLETHQEKRYRYQCPHCDSLYLRLQHLRRHIRDSHCNNEKRQNEIWHHFTKHSGHYKRHVTRCRYSHNNGSKMCELCDFKASSIRELERHKSEVHLINTALLQCEHCEYQTPCKQTLTHHLETHQKNRYRYQCPHCNSLYLRTQALRRHIIEKHITQEQQNEIWHHCSQPGCDYKSAQPNHLKRHMSTVHSTRRAYQCEHCDKTYKLKSHLRRHFKDSHFGQVYGDSGCDSQVRRFQCDFCEFKAKSEPVLKFHLMIHTGEKPYTCNICNRSFRQPNTLKMHINTHTGERPYKCRECGAAFSQHGSLYTHKKLIHHTK